MRQALAAESAGHAATRAELRHAQERIASGQHAGPGGSGGGAYGVAAADGRGGGGWMGPMGQEEPLLRSQQLLQALQVGVRTHM